MIRRTTSALALVAVATLAVSAHAGSVHRWLDGDTVVYSDQPPPPGVPPVPLPERETPPIVRFAEPVPAEAEPAGPATVDEILAASGIRHQLPGIARALSGEYLPRPGQLDERDAALVAQVVARHWAPEPLFAALREDFGRRVDARHLDAMAAWFRAPLGRKVTALEIAGSEPEAAARVAAFAAALKTVPASAARRDLVARLDWVSGTTDVSTDVALSIAGSVARATAATSPGVRRTAPGVIERRVEEMRSQVGAGLTGNVTTQMLYVYSPVSDDELNQYVDFLASPAGRAYSRASHAALRRVVREVADRTALDVLRAVPLSRWTAGKESAEATPRR
jgi:hypothetical protein